MRTADAANGKWVGILRHFGIDDSFLRNVHGPCPMCGGADRYRFDDRDGTGSYFCSGCGAGDGLDLAVKYTGREFKDIAAEIDSFVGNLEKEAPAKKAADPSIRINSVLARTVPIADLSPVKRYLNARSLPASKTLLCAPCLAYYDQGKQIAHYPAMVAKFFGPDGTLVTLHVTYLSNDGTKAGVLSPKKILPPIGKMDGGAVRLCASYETLGIAEGIETALAVMKNFKIPCWAATNANLLEKFQPPRVVKKIIVFGDKDFTFTGQKSAYILAHRLAISGLDVEVRLPDFIGDFADIRGGENA